MAEMEAQLQHRHGKARVRIGRVWRSSSRHIFVEWNVSVLLSSNSLPAFTSGDNSAVVATDSIKNTVYAKAKACTDVISMEEFGTLLGQHFVTVYPEVTGAQVLIVEKPWESITISGKVHKHGYKLGREKRTCDIVVSADRSVKVSSGIEGLSILKTTQSGFEGFIRDKYTLLPEVRERILATELHCVWRYCSKPSCYNQAHDTVKNTLLNVFFGPPETGLYSPSVQNTLYLMAQAVLQRSPEIESINLRMPNLHFLPVNMPTVGVQFKHDIYLPTDEPHGTIEASLIRKECLPQAKL